MYCVTGSPMADTCVRHHGRFLGRTRDTGPSGPWHRPAGTLGGGHTPCDGRCTAVLTPAFFMQLKVVQF